MEYGESYSMRNLWIGIAIVGFAWWMWPQPQPKVFPSEETSPSPKASVTSTPTAPAAPPTRAEVTIKPKPDPTPEPTPQANVSPKPTTTVSIDLSESNIQNMEHAWRDLPEQAEAKREDRGWRLTRVTPDSSFHQAGLRSGDLITTDFLSQMASHNSGGRVLALRFESILNRITR